MSLATDATINTAKIGDSFIGQTDIGALCVRDLPTTTNDGSQFTVTLELDVDEEDLPSGVIVNDWFPNGWTYISSNPTGTYNKPNKVKWLFISGDVVDRTITYTLEVPSGESGTYSFYGNTATSGNKVAHTGDCEMEVI